MSRALAEAGRLTPEIRLGLALSEFAGVGILDDARRLEFINRRRASPPSPLDVIRVTEEINRDGARQNKGWRPYATAMAKFLEQVQMVTQVGDLLVGGSQNMIATGVWAAVRISLSVATGVLSFFKQLSTLFLKLGRSSSITNDLVQLYPHNSELQKLMCEYLIILVSFCQKMVQALHKRRIAQITSPFVLFFDQELQSFETDMAHITSSIQQKASFLSVKMQQHMSGTLSRVNQSLNALVLSKDAKRSALHKKKMLVLRMLCPDKEQSLYDSTWRRERRRGTTTWLYEEQSYQSWRDAPSRSILWIEGKLGSGKTVLLANLCAQLIANGRAGEKEETRMKEKIRIARFFFTYEDRLSLQSTKAIGSLLRQIVEPLEPDSTIFTAMSTLLSDLGTWDSSLQERAIDVLVHDLVSQNRHMFILLDGLEHCPHDTLTQVLLAINTLSKSLPVHVCFSSRNNSTAVPLLMTTLGKPDQHISMANAGMEHEIRAFVETEFERRKHIRSLGPSLEAIIRDVLVGASEGMYLWIALQLDTLYPMYNAKLLSESDILKLLDDLPQGLGASFDRALERTIDKRYGNSIFQIVAGAIRPLTVNELRIALNITPGNITWNPLTVPGDGSALVGMCGGSLLEIDGETDQVRFIHHSAAQHLLVRDPDASEPRNPLAFTAWEADRHLGQLCVTYLNYPILDTTVARRNDVMVDSDTLVDRVVGLPLAESGISKQIISFLKRRRAHDEQALVVHVGRIVQQLSATDKLDARIFLAYAAEHWLEHTRTFSSRSCPSTYELFEAMALATAGLQTADSTEAAPKLSGTGLWLRPMVTTPRAHSSRPPQIMANISMTPPTQRHAALLAVVYQWWDLQTPRPASQPHLQSLLDLLDRECNSNEHVPGDLAYRGSVSTALAPLQDLPSRVLNDLLREILHDDHNTQLAWRVKTVVDLGADPNIACTDFQGDERGAMSLLRCGAEATVLLKHPYLIDAIERGWPHVVKFLLEKKSTGGKPCPWDINEVRKDGSRPPRLALFYIWSLGSRDTTMHMLELLLKAGADPFLRLFPSADDEHSFKENSIMREPDHLLRRGNRMTALEVAVLTNDLDMAQMMLQESMRAERMGSLDVALLIALYAASDENTILDGPVAFRPRQDAEALLCLLVAACTRDFDLTGFPMSLQPLVSTLSKEALERFMLTRNRETQHVSRQPFSQPEDTNKIANKRSLSSSERQLIILRCLKSLGTKTPWNELVQTTLDHLVTNFDSTLFNRQVVGPAELLRALIFEFDVDPVGWTTLDVNRLLCCCLSLFSSSHQAFTKVLDWNVPLGPFLDARAEHNPVLWAVHLRRLGEFEKLCRRMTSQQMKGLQDVVDMRGFLAEVLGHDQAFAAEFAAAWDNALLLHDKESCT